MIQNNLRTELTFLCGENVGTGRKEKKEGTTISSMLWSFTKANETLIYLENRTCLKQDLIKQSSSPLLWVTYCNVLLFSPCSTVSFDTEFPWSNQTCCILSCSCTPSWRQLPTSSLQQPTRMIKGLWHLSYDRWLFGMEKRRLRRDFISVYKCLKSGCQEEGTKLF